MKQYAKWTLVVLVVLMAGACAPGAADKNMNVASEPADVPVATALPNGEPAAAQEANPMASSAPASVVATADEKSDKSRSALGGKGAGQGEDGTITTWKRSQSLPNSSKLMVGDSESLALRAMQLKAQVDGFRARVVIDYYYANTSSRSYEGTFKMRLPNGASPYFFAFGETSVTASAADNGKPAMVSFEQARSMGVEPSMLMKEREGSWQKPKEARMVPRKQAARAYGETVRRNVDPALMEWAGAGVFSARVFPLAAGKLHHIVVGYDVDLLAVGNDLVFDTALPTDVPNLTVDFDVAMPLGTTLSLSDGAKTVDVAGRRYARFNQPKQRELRVTVKHQKQWMLVGLDDAVGHHYAAAYTPALPESAAATSARRAVLLLDTSLSSNPDKFNVWLKLAENLLTENRDAVDEFAVLFFNVEAHWWQNGFVANNDGNVKRLLADAGKLVLEGATDLAAALSEAGSFVSRNQVDADLFLLSDGAATWGERNLYAMSRALSHTALFAYRTGMADSDEQALTHLARETGGALFSVVGEAEVKQAARAHRSRPWQLVKAELTGSTEMMIAGRPKALFKGQRLLVVGRGEPEGALVLTLRQGGEEKQIKTEFAQLSSALTPRSYGMVAVSQLEALENAAQSLSKAYAAHYRVTGKSCSLLMLESEEDYRAQGITTEDDAKLVKSSLAAAAVSTALAEVEKSLGDPKAGFFSWLDQLATTPGAKVSLDKGFVALLQEMPSDRFAVPSQPLAVKQLSRAGIPEAFLGRLASRQIDYDIFLGEVERRRNEYGAADALKAFSSMVEHSPGDTVLARDIAAYASQHALPSHAFNLLRRVAEERPYEPQTYLGLARAAAQADRPELAMAYYEVGLAGQWDTRFGEIRRIGQLQYVRMLRDVLKSKAASPLTDYARRRLGKLEDGLNLGQADIVVVIMWNTDNTDIDLHVIEPSGEECFYSHRDTKTGGHMTEDVTQGYGPEMYTLKQAPDGIYQIRAKYFASDFSRASARTKVQALIFEHWGKPDERMTEKVVTLATGKEMHDIATIRFSR